jgi:hypothetical protein
MLRQRTNKGDSLKVSTENILMLKLVGYLRDKSNKQESGEGKVSITQNKNPCLYLQDCC